jgi:hypothetical protein
VIWEIKKDKNRGGINNNTMKKKYIGVTMMFWIKKNEMHKAVQSSYILKITDFLNFKNEINLLSLSLIETEFVGYRYSGITDLYVSEKEGFGNFLGRTSYFDYKTLSDAKKMVLGEFELNEIIESNTIFDRFNVGFVYFNEDSEGLEFNSTIIIDSQLTNVKNIEYLKSFANSILFKQKVIDFSVEQLYLDDLKFIGISAFYKIKEKGLFSISCNFKNIGNINSELIKSSELEQKFNEVLEDYNYVNL